VLEYQRDIPLSSTDEALEVTKQHVRDHLASLADADDDPTTHAKDVRVWTAAHPDNPGLLRVEGSLEAEAVAPYLEPGHDHLEGVDLELLAQFPAAMGLSDHG